MKAKKKFCLNNNLIPICFQNERIRRRERYARLLPISWIYNLIRFDFVITNTSKCKSYKYYF